MRSELFAQSNIQTSHQHQDRPKEIDPVEMRVQLAGSSAQPVNRASLWICQQRLVVRFGGATIANTTRGVGTIDGSNCVAYYFPPEDVNRNLLRRMHYRAKPNSIGTATYWILSVRGLIAEAAAWSYESPTIGYLGIRGHYSFEISRVDQSFVGSNLIKANTDGDCAESL